MAAKSPTEIRTALERLLARPVPPTIATDDEFRDIYTQGYRHALRDALALLTALPGETAPACSCQVDAHDFTCPTHGGDECESCGGSGFTFDAEGIEHNCYSCETTGKSMGAPMGKPIAERHAASAPPRALYVVPLEERLRHAWECGFRLAVAYGDNHHHWDGEQRERRWRDFVAAYPLPAPEAPHDV